MKSSLQPKDTSMHSKVVDYQSYRDHVKQLGISKLEVTSDPTRLVFSCNAAFLGQMVLYIHTL